MKENSLYKYIAGILGFLGLFMACSQEKDAPSEHPVDGGAGQDIGKMAENDADVQQPPGTIIDPGGDLRSDYVFDDKEIRTFTVTIDPEDWEELQASPNREVYFPASIRYEGFEFPRAAIRFKGGYGSLYSCTSGSRDCNKLPMKIKFSEYDDNRRFFGLKRINLHAMDRDNSRLREMIAYRLFRDFEVPASRTAFAHLVINGEPRGLYLAVEQVDGQFTRERFSDGGRGNLYKEVWFTENGWLEGLRTNRDDDPDVSAMLRMSQDFQSDEGDFLDKLNRWVEVPTLMRYLAVEITIGHFDGITAWYTALGNHNFYIYEYTTAEKVVLIAWDLDNSLNLYDAPNPLQDVYDVPAWDDLDIDCEQNYTVYSGLRARAPACDPFMKGLASEMWHEYAEATQELLDSLFIEERIGEQIDTYAHRIEDAIAEDKRGPNVEQWWQEVAKLKEDIGILRERALREISSEIAD